MQEQKQKSMTTECLQIFMTLKTRVVTFRMIVLVRVRKIIAQSRYAQVESQVPVFPFIVFGAVQGQVVQCSESGSKARKGRTGYCEWKWSVISCAGGG